MWPSSDDRNALWISILIILSKISYLFIYFYIITNFIIIFNIQVPIVRKTGGLADTVFDMDDESHPEIANG